MIERYQTDQLRDIWSEENKFDKWLEVELASCCAWSNLGLIPKEDVEALIKNARVDVKRIHEIELQTKHDVIAFTRAVSETCKDEKKWFHYGLTSTDVVDTAQALILAQANTIIEQDLMNMLAVLKKQALKYKLTPMIGRTHGVHAEPTTFGLTVLLWYEEMARNLSRFKQARLDVEVGKISGAVGTHANVPLEVEEMICKQLNIGYANVSTQVLQRDRHAHYMSVLGLIASSVEKMAVQIRHLQRTEVREVQEYFDQGQKGSSAMPHKRNPIGSENVSGLARIVRGYVMPAYENMALWHERDISHSSTERIMLPDATSLVNYMLVRFTHILDTMLVHEQRMLDNLNSTNGLIFSQQVLLTLIENGLSRERAYDLVQPLAMKAWDENTSFKQLLLENDQVVDVLTKEQLENCFNIQHHFKNIDSIFSRVF